MSARSRELEKRVALLEEHLDQVRDCYRKVMLLVETIERRVGTNGINVQVGGSVVMGGVSHCRYEPIPLTEAVAAIIKALRLELKWQPAADATATATLAPGALLDHTRLLQTLVQNELKSARAKGKKR